MDAKAPVLTPGSYANLTAVLVPGLKAVRLERAYSQELLAERAGLGRKTIIRGESGQHIRVSSVRRLAAALHVVPRRLLQSPPT